MVFGYRNIPEKDGLDDGVWVLHAIFDFDKAFWLQGLAKNIGSILGIQSFHLYMFHFMLSFGSKKKRFFQYFRSVWIMMSKKVIRVAYDTFEK
jgi:hypothetical protein